MTKTMVEDPLKYAVQEEDVQSLCKAFFGIDLHEVQESIVRDIAFQKHNRLFLNTYT